MLYRCGPATFVLVSGGGEPPARLDSYTTLFTAALDLAIITTGALVTGAVILRLAPLGYISVIALLFLEAMLAPMIVAQTASQLSAGVELAPGEIIGPVAGFVVVTVVALWLLVTILRNVSASSAWKSGRITKQ